MSTTSTRPTTDPNPVTAAPASSWPSQLSLPGQAAAPEGPVDMTMMYVMHAAFRRDLALFTAAARHTPLHDRSTWGRLTARWQLFAEILHHHHQGEDNGIWPLLMARADARGQEVLTAMEAEHDEIDPLLEACAAGFRGLAGTDDYDARAALVVRLTAAQQSLARHLAHEETDAIALLQRHVGQEEWALIDAEHFGPQHLPKRTVLGLVPWAMSELPDPARARVLATAPAALRLIWRLTRRGFARQERRTFRYAG